MSTPKPENPPAFPEVFTDLELKKGRYYSDTYSSGGMSLRDYFAAKAMQAIISTMKFNIYDAGPNDTDCLIAQRAGRIADAMLTERAKNITS